MEVIDAAIRVIPHIGPLLARVLCLVLEVGEELRNLPSKFHAEKELGEEASDIICDIALHSRNLEIRYPRHGEKLKRKAKTLEDVAKEIQKHVWKISGRRQIIKNDFGEKVAHLVECLQPSDTWILKRRLQEAKDELIKEFVYIKMLEETGEMEMDLPQYSEHAEEKYDFEAKTSLERARWVKKLDLDRDPSLLENLVPVCSRDATEDDMIWYIARVPYLGGQQPGKFNLHEKIAYYGYCRRVFPSNNFEVLVAERDSVCWKRTSGYFAETHLEGARPVEGCRENDDTFLAIARARAKEHMHVGVFQDKFIQLGKASKKLHGAYLAAGKKEAHVRDNCLWKA